MCECYLPIPHFESLSELRNHHLFLSRNEQIIDMDSCCTLHFPTVRTVEHTRVTVVARVPKTSQRAAEVLVAHCCALDTPVQRLLE